MGTTCAWFQRSFFVRIVRKKTPFANCKSYEPARKRNIGWTYKSIEKDVPTIIDLANDEQKQMELKNNIAALAVTDADRRNAKEILKAINK